MKSLCNIDELLAGLKTKHDTVYCLEQKILQYKYYTDPETFSLGIYVIDECEGVISLLQDQDLLMSKL